MSCAYGPPLPQTQGRLVSRYGVRRGRTSGNPTFHAGLDLRADRGAPVSAMADGVVERVAEDQQRRGGMRGYGNAVVLRHDRSSARGHTPVWTLYAHLAEVTVRVGQPVAAGTAVGTVGNTSNGKFPGMGAHLHIELRRAKPDGSSPLPGPYRAFNLDPEPWLAAGGVTFGPRGQIQWDRQLAQCRAEAPQHALVRFTEPWRSWKGLNT